MNDFTRAMLERPNMTVDPTLDQADRDKEIDRISKSGLMAMFAGMTSFAAPAAEFARAVAEPPQAHPEIDRLNTIVERQSREIGELRSRMASAFGDRDVAAKASTAPNVRAGAARTKKTPAATTSTRRKSTK
jgi:hypothetical protein